MRVSATCRYTYNLHRPGHFVVLTGYEPRTGEVVIADPLLEKPRFRGHHYHAPIRRLGGAIPLGVLTYDANFLILEPDS